MSLTRVCIDCKQELPIDTFEWRSAEHRYRKSYCRPCARLRGKRWQLANPEYGATWAAAHQASLRESWRRRAKPKLQYQDTAHKAVRRAIQRGELVRSTSCEECGTTGRMDAAHYDYSRPLDVRWLCRPCHTKWDARQPKSVKGN